MLTNWRCHILMLLFGATMLLTLCEAETIRGLLVTKAVGVGVGYVAYRLFRHWDDKGLIDELTDERV